MSYRCPRCGSLGPLNCMCAIAKPPAPTPAPPTLAHVQDVAAHLKTIIPELADVDQDYLNALVKLHIAGAITPNEIRNRFGMTPLPDPDPTVQLEKSDDYYYQMGRKFAEMMFEQAEKAKADQESDSEVPLLERDRKRKIKT